MIRRTAVGMAVAAALVTTTVPALAGECITAATSTTIMIPDGSVHAPGAIEVCLRKRLAPTVGVLAISIDGERIGNFMSRIESLDGPGLGTFVQFRRNDDDQLLIEGFTLRRGSGLEGFRIQTRFEGRRPYYPDLAIDSDHDGEKILKVHYGQVASIPH